MSQDQEQKNPAQNPKTQKMNEQLLRDILESATFEKMKLADITPAPYNPRADLQPDDWEYQQIEESIANHGLLQPIIYNKRTGYAVGGNQRLKILTDHGIKEATCAVIDIPLMREMEVNIALNRLGNSWDWAKLREGMLELQESGYDLRKTAFSEQEVESITRDMDQSIASFFQDEESSGGESHKTKHTYKCPYCGEIFEH